MDTPINDGGPAFPMQDWDECIQTHRTETGMTLRDWFAGQALAGLLTQPAEIEFGAMHFAKGAYEMADAMLKARREVQHG
jgi:hypothetical protein